MSIIEMAEGDKFFRRSGGLSFADHEVSKTILPLAQMFHLSGSFDANKISPAFIGEFERQMLSTCTKPYYKVYTLQL